jgi:type IV secretion system protein TrbD
MSDTTSRAREVPIFQSGVRPNLFLGCDREMVLTWAILCVALVFSIGTWWFIPVGGGLWLAGVAVLYRLGKMDPLLRQKYLRHMRYQDYYPAKSGPFAQPRRVRDSWR